MKTYNLYGAILNCKIKTYNTLFKYIVLRKNKQGKYYIAYRLSNDIWSEHPFHKIRKWPSKRHRAEFGGIQTFSYEMDAKKVMKRILKYSSKYPRRFVLSDWTCLSLILFAIFVVVALI